MPRTSRSKGARAALAALAACALSGALASVSGGQAGPPAPVPGADWPFWGADTGSRRYSSLDQIDAGNAGQLEIAWRWRADNFGPAPEYYYRATPIKVGSRLYTVAGERRAVVAIDPGTGETLWVWRIRETARERDSARRFSGRGLAWANVGGRDRIYVVTPGFFLAAIDAETGRPVAGFGTDGIVDLMEGLGFPFDKETGIDPKWGHITSGSPPIVINGVVVVNNASDRGYYPKSKQNIPGHVRGYDARTGKQLWIFHVIPKPGEFGHDTWEGDSWKYTGNVNTWVPLSADAELGLVYLPTDCPTGDYYGGHRHGDNLFGTSVVALDVKTGKRVWHQQLVRHDVWNYDNPTAPNLADIDVGGKRVKAIVQTTKQGWAYVFDRKTGEPVWPMEELRVPTDTDVPGEKLSPTQRLPTKPKPYEQQGTSVDDLIDFTPELRQQAIAIASKHRMGPLFTPPMLARGPNNTEGGVLQSPGANGGTNIPGGAAVDPETGILYVATERGHSRISMVHDPKKSDMDYISLGPSGIQGPQGLPLFKPPYGQIVAIDLNTGEHVWAIPNGDTPERMKRHPALKGVTLPRTGKRAHATVLVTKTLLFYGEGVGQGDPWFHAVDKKTGREIAAIALPATTNAAPMTYLHEGRQFIVVAVGAAPDHPGELVAIGLPRKTPPPTPSGQGGP